MSDVVWREDKELLERWHCSKMKLYRMRQTGKLNSIKIGGSGAWLTSDAEIARIEAPPDKAKPGPCVSPQGTGPTASKHKHPLDSESPDLAQLPSNGGA